jgi:hypothetical protein
MPNDTNNMILITEAINTRNVQIGFVATPSLGGRKLDHQKWHTRDPGVNFRNVPGAGTVTGKRQMLWRVPESGAFTYKEQNILGAPFVIVHTLLVGAQIREKLICSNNLRWSCRKKQLSRSI